MHEQNERLASVETQVAVHEKEIKELRYDVKGLTKHIYIGMGVVSAVSWLLTHFVK